MHPLFRPALRLVARKPAFSSVIILTLALGIGPNTAIFTFVHGLLLRPLAFPRFEELIAVWETDLRRGKDRENAAPANFLDWKRETTQLEQLAAYDWWEPNITGTGEPEQAQGIRVTGNFFATLGVPAFLGSVLTTNLESEGRDDLVVLSYGLWQRRFGANPAVVGRTLALNGRSHTIIGVTPADFNFPPSADLWTPLRFSPEEAATRHLYSLQTLGRLKPGAGKEQAAAELEAIARRLAEQYPRSNSGRGIHLVTLQERLILESGTREPLLILMWASALVLVLACANVSNLLLGRAVIRKKEMAIQATLGASQGKMIAQVLAEGALLGLMSSLAALLLALWCIHMIKGNLPPDIVRFVPGWKEIRLDAPACVFMLAAALLAGIFAGLPPALLLSRADLHSVLKEGGRSGTAGRSSHALRNALVVIEVGLSLILLVGAAVMLKGFNSLLNLPRGFTPDGVLTARLTLPESRYPSGRQITRFFEEALRAVEAIPQVKAAAISTHLPFAHKGWAQRGVQIEGRPPPRPEEVPQVAVQTISPNYFRVLQIPVLAERVFSDRESADSPPVAVISGSFARQGWAGEIVVGKRLQFFDLDGQDSWMTIVGVVGDVRRHWTDKNLEAIYLPYQHLPQRRMTVAWRSAGNPKQILASVRTQLKQVDADVPLTQVKPLNQIINESMAGLRLAAGILAFMGALAALLAGAGIYSVMSYSVAQRRQEIGIRLALGGQRRQIIRLILVDAAKLSALGLAAGLPGAFALSRLLGKLWFGMSPLDFLLVLGFAFISATLVTAGSLLPARKAMNINPALALHPE